MKRRGCAWLVVAVGHLLWFAAMPVQAQSGFREIASFRKGTVAELGITIEYMPDRSRTVDVRFNRHPHGGTSFFTAEQWKRVGDVVAEAERAPEDVPQNFEDIATASGTLLRVSSVRHGGEVRLTLSRQPGKGDSYPAVVFHLSPGDFTEFRKAVAEAASRLAAK